MQELEILDFYPHCFHILLDLQNNHKNIIYHGSYQDEIPNLLDIFVRFHALLLYVPNTTIFQDDHQVTP